MLRTRSPRLQQLTRPGISLMEVLLATVIFMMALSGISLLIRTAVDNAFSASRTSTGSSLARTKMAELEAGASDVDLATGGTGSFTNQPDWNYQVVSSQVSAGCYQVDIQVWANSDSSRRDQVTLTQMIFDPNAMNNAAAATAPDTGSTP